MTVSLPTLTRKDFVSSQEVKWCPGCGDYAVLAQVQRVLPELGIPRERFVIVSGIGCSSRFPYYVATYGVHGIHGRAPAIATGIALARPDLTVLVVTGDGDALSIGGNHLIHALRRNVNITILMLNNRVYGLTKGQASPTTEQGKTTKSTPYGSLDRPFEPIALALGADASFVARVPDSESALLRTVITRAVQHRGAAFVEILQNCPVFNDGAHEALTDKATKAERQLVLEQGKPLLFAGGARGVRVGDGYAPEVVEIGGGSGQAPASECIVHDEASGSAALATLLARLAPPRFPTAMGVLRAVERPTLGELVLEQESRAIAARGPTTLEDLWRSGDVWTVGAQATPSVPPEPAEEGGG